MPEESRIMRKLTPANEWSWNEILLNKIEHAVRVLIWQNSADGHQEHPKYYPETWLPDFFPKPKKPKKNTEEVGMSVDELKEFLSRPRQGANVEPNE